MHEDTSDLNTWQMRKPYVTSVAKVSKMCSTEMNIGPESTKSHAKWLDPDISISEKS